MPIAVAGRLTSCVLVLLAGACAPVPITTTGAAGKPASEVSKLVAASDAKSYPCNISAVTAAAGAEGVDLGGLLRPEVTLPPGRYRVTMKCASPYHAFNPHVDLTARAGKGYRLTGFLIDDSITLFTMKMAIRVTELAP